MVELEAAIVAYAVGFINSKASLPILNYRWSMKTKGIIMKQGSIFIEPCLLDFSFLLSLFLLIIYYVSQIICTIVKGEIS